MCYVSGRTDPTQFFYNVMVVFDAPPDLHTLKRSIEQHINDDALCSDGAEFIVSDIEILDFRVNSWVNLESRAQLYSGCHLTVIRSLIGATCSGAVDRSNKTSMQKVLGFAIEAQRMFEVLDVDDENKIRLKGLLKVLRHNVDYAVDVFSFLDRNSEGFVSFQNFLISFNDFNNRNFFGELQKRISSGGRKVDGFLDSGDAPNVVVLADKALVKPGSSTVGVKKALLPGHEGEDHFSDTTVQYTEAEKSKASKIVEMFKKKSQAKHVDGDESPKVSQGVLNKLRTLAKSGTTPQAKKAPAAAAK